MKKLRTNTTGFVLVFVLFLSANPLRSQHAVIPACVEADWNKIFLSKGNIPDSPGKIFMIVNRPFLPVAEDREYFPNAVADSVTYVIAICTENGWLFYVVPGFEEGMKAINDGRDILVFLEGHGKTLPEALDRAYQVQARYGLSLVVFDWPSDNRNFNSSLRAISLCGENFYRFLLQLKRYRKLRMSQNQRLSILAHSMGNYFLTNSLVPDRVSILNEIFIDNIVMNAPAIPSKGHDKTLSQMAFQKRVYITSNKNDLVLRGAGALTFSKMLGNVAVSPLSANVNYIDFSGVAETEHSYYYGRQAFEHTLPAFFYFYDAAFHGNDVDLSDTLLFVPRNDGKRYDVKGIWRKE